MHALAPMDIKPKSSSQSETTVSLKSFYSMEAEDADNTQERDALYRWPQVRSDAASDPKDQSNGFTWNFLSNGTYSLASKANVL